ncbi:MAG: DUF975 family protein [Bacillota bacterium]
MFRRSDFKNAAKLQLQGKWGNAVLTTFIVELFLFVASILAGLLPFVGGVAGLILAGPVEIGFIIYFMVIVKGTEIPDVSVAFRGFRYFEKTLGIYLWVVLWVLLWSLLFIIPGIIKAISYSQAFYIVADNPNVKVRDALKMSMRMTKGYKWDIFIMGLSFLGWALLCLFSLLIGFLWLTPYMMTSYTNMYFWLKNDSLQSGACSAAEFEV